MILLSARGDIRSMIPLMLVLCSLYQNSHAVTASFLWNAESWSSVNAMLTLACAVKQSIDTQTAALLPQFCGICCSDRFICTTRAIFPPAAQNSFHRLYFKMLRSMWSWCKMEKLLFVCQSTFECILKLIMAISVVAMSGSLLTYSLCRQGTPFPDSITDKLEGVWS